MEVDKISEKVDILFLGETCMRTCDVDISVMLDEFLYAPKRNSTNKGFGGLVVIVNPMIKYEVVRGTVTKNPQSLTIRTKGIQITGIYVSPKSKEVEELYTLEKVKQLSRGRSIIIDDINARHKN